MGGSTSRDISNAVGGVASDSVKVASRGTVDLEKKKVSFNPSTMLEGYAEGTAKKSSVDTVKAAVTPDIKLPEEPSMSEADKALEDAKRKAAELAKGGIGSTILGGSLGDNGNIRKKKLLGQ